MVSPMEEGRRVKELNTRALHLEKKLASHLSIPVLFLEAWVPMNIQYVCFLLPKHYSQVILYSADTRVVPVGGE